LFIDNTNDDSLLTDVLRIACSSSEDTVNRETAMLSIHILAKAFCSARKAPFETVLHEVTDIAVTLTATLTAVDDSNSAASDTPATATKSNKRKSSKASIEAAAVAAVAVLAKQSSEIKSTLGLASSTFMCLATLVALLKTKAFIKVPQYLPAMLTAIEWSVRTTTAITTASTDSNGDTMDTSSSGDTTAAAVALQQATVLLQQSVLSSITAVINSLPQFLHPHMHRVLTVALQPVLLKSTSTNSYVNKLFNALVTSGMQSRLLLPCVFKAYSISMAPVSLCRLHDLIGAVIDHLERPAVIAHLDELTAFYIGAMDYRRLVATVTTTTTTTTAAATDAADAVDASAIAAVMVLVLKLNENELRGLFMQLCRWKDQQVTINTAAATTSSVLHRRVTFYKLVQVMSGTLKTIFVPYFAHVLSDVKAILSIVASTTADTVASSSDDSKKRRKRQKLGNDTSTTAAVLALTDSAGVIAQDVKQSYITVCHTITAALKNCFQYDRQSFIDASRFELIMPVLVDQLDATLLVLSNDDDHSTDTIAAIAPTTTTVSHAEYIENTLSPCIAHLAAAAGKDTLWKPLVNAVLMKTRHSSSAIRLGAIQVLQKCFVIVGEEFLVLIPECLPFLSELMEDASQPVEQATRTLIKYIEDVLGESVESYLS
jgi:U3 small nucleolar RNA-associated protein 10